MGPYLALQISKGKLDYKLVVSKYPQYKEIIDTILIGDGNQDLIVNEIENDVNRQSI